MTKYCLSTGDDSIAFNWMAGISWLTFWMKLNYNEQERVLFRNTFLEHYRTASNPNLLLLKARSISIPLWIL